MDKEVELQGKNSVNYKDDHRDEKSDKNDIDKSNLSDIPTVELQLADEYEKKGDIVCRSLDNPDISDLQSGKLKQHNMALGNSFDNPDISDTQSADSGIVGNNINTTDTEPADIGIMGNVLDTKVIRQIDNGITENNPATSDAQSTELQQNNDIQQDKITTVKIEVEIKDENTVSHNSSKLPEIPGNEDAKLNGNQFNVIRSDGDMTSDSDSDSDSDSSSSSSSDSEDALKITQKCADIEMDDDDSDKGKKSNKSGTEDIRTKGELFPEELPPIEQLNIAIGDDIELKEIGTISSIVGILVIVQSNKDTPPLNEQTFVFHDRKAIGQIFEVFGPVAIPWYSIRFNSVEDVHKLDLQVGNTVYFAPNATDFTNYVFVQDLKSIKGSDASWENNNEPPAKHIDYSDDEDEKRAKAKKRNSNFEAVIKKEVEEGNLLPGANPCHEQRNSSRSNKRQKGKRTNVNGQQNHNNKTQANQLHSNHLNDSAIRDYSGTHFYGNHTPGFVQGHSTPAFTQRPKKNNSSFQNTNFTHRNRPHYFRADRPRMQNFQPPAYQPRWPQTAGPTSRWPQPPLQDGWQQSMSPSNQNIDLMDGKDPINQRTVNFNNGQNNRYSTDNWTEQNHMGDRNRFRSNMHHTPGSGNKFINTNGSNIDIHAYWPSPSTSAQSLCYQQNFKSNRPPLNSGHQPNWYNLPTPGQSCSTQNSNSNQNSVLDRRLVVNQQLNPSTDASDRITKNNAQFQTNYINQPSHFLRQNNQNTLPTPNTAGFQRFPSF